MRQNSATTHVYLNNGPKTHMFFLEEHWNQINRTQSSYEHTSTGGFYNYVTDTCVVYHVINKIWLGCALNGRNW